MYKLQRRPTPNYDPAKRNILYTMLYSETWELFSTLESFYKLQQNSRITTKI